MNRTENLFRNDYFREVALYYDRVMKASFEFCSSHNILTVPLPANTSMVSCPSSTGSDTSSCEIVKTNDQGKSYLNDSTQFMLELLARLTGRNVFSLTPCYRTDLPDETHLSMFYYAEFEIHGYLEDAMRLAEQYVRLVGSKFVPDLNLTFDRITLDDACEILEDEDVKQEGGVRRVTRAGERALIDYFQGPVWLMYPDSRATPFFQAFHHNGYSSLAADLLMGVGETIGLGQRHSTVERLEEALLLHNLDPEPYKDYIDMRNQSSTTTSTSGFGAGIERLLMFILGKNDIRELVIFPRDNYKRPYL